MARPLSSATLRRTVAFYEWEVGGRGWYVDDQPIRLEPPLVPYLRPGISDSGQTDDARRPTWLSDAWESFSGRGENAARESALDHPAPEYHPQNPTEPIREFDLWIGGERKASKGASSAWLQNLSHCRWPISLELSSAADGVRLILAVRESDSAIARNSLRAYFPDVDLLDDEAAWTARWRSEDAETTVVEFGLGREFMLPLRQPGRDPDPLVPLVGTLAAVPADEIAVLQILFEEAHSPWAENILRAVTTSRGEPFFADDPGFTDRARTKVASPLYAVTLRVGVRARSEDRTWEVLRQLAGGLAQFGGPQDNVLISLSGRDNGTAEGDLLGRISHRAGMIWNLDELVALAHIPEDLRYLGGLKRDSHASRKAPADLGAGELLVGINDHRGKKCEVWLSESDRLRHTHIVGASGTGKSTLLRHLIRQDMEAGRGVAVLDPHGDLAEDVLGHVPKSRVDEVILIDPAQGDVAVGWNVLSADSPSERDILSSDLVAVFRRLSTSWGDQMTTVLGNAVDVFLERGGTLLDLRRFLIEEPYRREVIGSVQDEYLRSYWTTEFPLIVGRKPQAPILTRLNTFLRPPIVRRVVTEQANPIDFREVVDRGQILVANLAQGTIGAENAALLGALLVSKFYQTTIARQLTEAESRRPFYLYIDEFHQVATPSMATLFAGMRKYRLGLVVAHQDLEQLRSTSSGLEQAVLANAHTRIAFRLGDRDAREFGNGFAGFRDEDLASLGVGEAICRVGGRDRSFNFRSRLPGGSDTRLEEARRDEVRAASLHIFGRLANARPSIREKAIAPVSTPIRSAEDVARPPVQRVTTEARPRDIPVGQGGPEHQYLQGLIREWAHERGFLVTIEEPLQEGGRVDIALRKDGRMIACEIAVTTPATHEIANIEKCLEAGFGEVLLVSRRRSLLDSVGAELETRLESSELRKVQLLSPEELWTLFDQEPHPESESATVAGYSVNVRVRGTKTEESRVRSRAITEVIARSVRKLGKGET